jgi:hypothetical protein
MHVGTEIRWLNLSEIHKSTGLDNEVGHVGYSIQEKAQALLCRTDKDKEQE